MVRLSAILVPSRINYGTIIALHRLATMNVGTRLDGIQTRPI